MKRPGDDDNPQESHFALLPHEESGERVDHDGNEPEMTARDGQGEKRNIELEYETPNTIKFLWLGTYFFFSLMLTLYNKLVLGSFRFPWLLTSLHATFASVGTAVLLKLGYFKLSHLGRKEHATLAAFSVLFTANIAVSNLSLSLVSLAFFQIIRTTVPLFTVGIYRIWFSRLYATSTYISLLPIVLGAGLTTMGEYKYSTFGLLVTCLGVVLAAVKTVTTNRLMTGTLALPSIELLLRMSPLAAIQALLYAILSGELSAFADKMAHREGNVSNFATILFLLGNGLLAFLLNVSSFQTNKLAGALAISVCGNLKQVLTVVLGIFTFGDFAVDIWNGTGMLLAMTGCVMYSKAELDSKSRKK